MLLSNTCPEILFKFTYYLFFYMQNSSAKVMTEKSIERSNPEEVVKLLENLVTKSGNDRPMVQVL